VTGAAWTRRLLATALLLGVVGPVRAQQPEVVGLRFEGTTAFTDEELTAAIATRATRCRNPIYQVLLLCWAGIGEEEVHLEPEELEADAFRLKVYYYERGFREARVFADTARVGDGVVVTFQVDEGRPVRVSAVELEGMPPGVEPGAAPLAVGDPFDVVAYEATRDTLRARLRNNGYARARVLLGYTILRVRPYDATVQYTVSPGPLMRIGRIRVEGAVQTSPELVRRVLTFDEGDRYDRSALLESQRNLYGLRIFRHAIVEDELDEVADSAVPVRVRLAEGDMRRVRLGGGANTIECVNVEGRWLNRNFLGGGRRLTVTGRLGNLLIDRCDFLVDEDRTTFQNLTGLVSVDFSQPWVFGPRNRLGLGLFAERRNVPEVFVRTAAGGYLSVGRDLGTSATLTLAYRPEVTELTTHRGGDLFYCVSFVGCTFQDVQVLRDPHLLSPLTLSFTVDRTNELFAPTEGYVLRADVEHANRYTLSDFAYTRLLGEGSAYVGEADGLVLATRIRGGVGWAHPGGVGSETLGLNPQKRFFAGGPNSVRGFDQYRLGPTVLGIEAVPWLVAEDDPTTSRMEGAGCTADEVNELTCDVSELARRAPELFEQRPAGGEVLLEGNVELRFPLPLLDGKLRGAAFLDAGQVWRARADVALGEIVATPGLGVRYYSPVGPIRVDAAFNPGGVRDLRVLTTRVRECLDVDPECQRVGDASRATLKNTDTVAPLVAAVPFGTRLRDIDSVGDLLRRFNLQFSIGQAF
jgi:outer membrane protein assembly complex protein YaeT